MPAGALASGRVLHCTASISNHYPKQYTDVTAKIKAKDQNGKAITGVKCVFTWHYKTTTPVVTRYTNSNGVATCTRAISRATKGYKVVINIKCSWSGQVVNRSTWFIPQ
jgi:hypothetical protein